MRYAGAASGVISWRSRPSSLTLPSSRYRRKIDLTSSASSSTMAILPSFISYPQGRVPPTQRPLRLDAAILSRIRSEVTSRSNCAKDKSTLSVSRPIEVVVLNCWVTETNQQDRPQRCARHGADDAGGTLSPGTWEDAPQSETANATDP